MVYENTTETSKGVYIEGMGWVEMTEQNRVQTERGGMGAQKDVVSGEREAAGDGAK